MSTNGPMTREQLDAIQERVDATQNTPWQRGEDDEPMPSTDDYMSTVNDHDGDPVGYCPDCGVRSYYSAQAADLIAHAPQDLTDLLAEVDRLRALTTVDDAMVERGARVLGNRRHRGIHRGWDGATSAARDGWRDEARAALDAALGTGENG